MISLSLGLLAAFSWAVHDLLVRKISATVGVFASLFTVLVLGTLAATPVALVNGDLSGLSRDALIHAAGAGLFYAVAGIGLYRALAIGPVRLVAPIIGAYPILSMFWVFMSGNVVEPLHWLAVIVVVAGVAFIAISSDGGESDGSKGSAIFWSLVAGPGFAIAFALSQEATGFADEWSISLPMRGTAIIVVLVIALAIRAPIMPPPRTLWVFAIMGVMDVIALGAVSAAGNFANPEFASVAASTFGLLTVVLASIFLRERLHLMQWAAVVLVFAAIGSLGI